MKRVQRILAGAVAAMVLCSMVPVTAFAAGFTGWKTDGGKSYWYENDVLQGTEGRGKEIYDPDSNAWYWLDSVQGGAKAVSKDVYQESSGGKWVRYDENGHMIKGWQTTSAGTYYFDLITGAMAKGRQVIDGKECWFDENNGIGLNLTWKTIDGKDYWYENGVRQGLEGRGKEIYDAGSGAWYWLDSVQGGAKAVSKDVYQESSGGKWVRYDENGRMIKGEDFRYGGWYRFDLITGAMIKGWFTTGDNTYYYDTTTGQMVHGDVTIDGASYHFDAVTGVCSSPVTMVFALSQIVMKDAAGKVTGSVRYQYNAQGRLVRITRYDAVGAVTDDTTYDFSGGLLQKSSSRFYSGGVLNNYFISNYTYDDAGALTEVADLSVASNGTTAPMSKAVYTNDSDGNAIRIDFYGNDGKLSSHKTMTYQNGVLVREDSYTDAGTTGPILQNTYTLYTYDASGKMAEMKTYDSASDKLVGSSTYSNGLLTAEQSAFATGVMGGQTLTYDENGHLAKIVRTSYFDGTLEATTLYSDFMLTGSGATASQTCTRYQKDNTVSSAEEIQYVKIPESADYYSLTLYLG